MVRRDVAAQPLLGGCRLTFAVRLVLVVTRALREHVPENLGTLSPAVFLGVSGHA